MELSCHIFCVRLLCGHVHPHHVQYSAHGWNSLSLLPWQDSEQKLNALQLWLRTWAVRAGEYFKQPCCLPTAILTLVIMVLLGEPRFFLWWYLVEKFEKCCSIPCHSSQSLEMLHTGPLSIRYIPYMHIEIDGDVLFRLLSSALGHLYYLFLGMPLLTLRALKVLICVCVWVSRMRLTRVPPHPRQGYRCPLKWHPLPLSCWPMPRCSCHSTCEYI